MSINISMSYCLKSLTWFVSTKKITDMVVIPNTPTRDMINIVRMG